MLQGMRQLPDIMTSAPFWAAVGPLWAPAVRHHRPVPSVRDGKPGVVPERAPEVRHADGAGGTRFFEDSRHVRDAARSSDSLDAGGAGLHQPYLHDERVDTPASDRRRR